MTELQRLELKKLELQLLLLKEEAKAAGIKINDHSPENCNQPNSRQPYFHKGLNAWVLPHTWNGERWAKWLGFDSVLWPIEPHTIHEIQEEEADETEIEVPDVSPAGEPYTAMHPEQKSE